jgi:hypothetical protein
VVELLVDRIKVEEDWWSALEKFAELVLQVVPSVVVEVPG